MVIIPQNYCSPHNHLIQTDFSWKCNQDGLSVARIRENKEKFFFFIEFRCEKMVTHTVSQRWAKYLIVFSSYFEQFFFLETSKWLNRACFLTTQFTIGGWVEIINFSASPHRPCYKRANLSKCNKVDNCLWV